MDLEKLIEQLRSYTYWLGQDGPESHDIHPLICDDAATALSTLQEENEEMQNQLNEFSEFLCYMTGGLLSKTNYTAQEMVSAAEDYQQRLCNKK